VTKAAADAMVQEYDAGATLRTIGARHNVHAAWVHQLLREAGVKFRPPGSRLAVAITAEDVAEFGRRYEAGASLQEIADGHGVSLATVRRRLAAAGVPIRPPGGRQNFTRAAVSAEQANRLVDTGEQ
jgi:hypothetical protein